LYKKMVKQWEFYVFLIPALLAVLFFNYLPMYGVQYAFKNLEFGTRIESTSWVGFYHFIRFFRSGWFLDIIKNTVVLSLGTTIITWPFPIILGIMLHNCTNKGIKKFSQTATYIPQLISIVVTVSIMNIMLSRESGIVNILLEKFGMESIAFFGSEKWVAPLYVISDLWQHMGFNAIIYMAALSSVNPEVTEAGLIDGASKFQRIIYIDIPSIMPTIIYLLILKCGSTFAIGPEKMLLLQTPLNIGAAEILPTYVYKTGILSGQYSFAIAIGLLSNLVNLMLLVIVNWIAKKKLDTSLF